MYVEDFEAFYEQAVALYQAKPLETRYTIKFRHSEGKVVLKVTDDRTCLKFKTDQQVDLRKIERITTIFFPLMACGELPAEGQDAAAAQQAPAAAATQSGGAGGKKARRRG
ncbi:hypothetical protein CHLRE_12g546250v5 [Chlamydomonas reinhardtii]|uniref:Signal recognition particle 9 kDa protein n=1 Tax=Chlamydomonas reinhardtii TaxID=3055 RepID=A8IY91_CHLRE|nr:uncharacterized protein CHLRE_12g546250v5 [Chlamydomonas reinhardtii]PNW76139.1 hypothetical protein CHLRE_12g546250v5 [Chlamydomonas reinhardtii]|eukprot:XP_001694097.1 subunit of the signal recognition particle [Chlamydomonas reinhardtii]